MITPIVNVYLAEGFNVRLSFVVSQNDFRMVVIKAPVKPAPAVHSFFVMVYRCVLLHGLYTALWSVMWVLCSLVPRHRPAFHCLQLGGAW